ncbi:MAG: hypothetical protein LBC41_13370 [Clostridiales bacterium]|jgi:hypothetical protein|nr:hypothetical protein [Clostridiales bacterium]MDR2751641.1 hypothetical protein [Clostridiales bacterium]
MENIQDNDVAILRDLAKHQQEIANSPANLALVKEWEEHNSFRGKRPMVYLETGTLEQELIPPLLKCEGPEARKIESNLWHNMLNHVLIGDDSPVIDHYSVSQRFSFALFGLRLAVTHDYPESGQPEYLEQFYKDPRKFKKSTFAMDKKGEAAELAQAQELFGDILPSRVEHGCVNVIPLRLVAHLIGIKNLYISMGDHPDKLKQLMKRVTEDVESYFRVMEKEKLITPTSDCQRIFQGSFCCTTELPKEIGAKPLTTKDVWGYMDSFETLGVSPDAFGEFFFPYLKSLASNFTHLSYGSDEPVNEIWEKYISAIPSVKKVSISYHCDEKFMGKKLRGKNVIYNRKPKPEFLLAETLDEDAIKAHIKTTLDAAKGCKLEITQRGIGTVNGDITKAKRYVALIRETIEESWKG